MIKIQTHAVLNQSLFSFQCPTQPLNTLQRFANDLPWESVPQRGESQKAGRSYIHPQTTLEAVEKLNELHSWIRSCLNLVRKHVGWRNDTIRELAITQSWLNRSDIGEEHHRHYHPLSILSGILYLTEPSTTKFFLPSIYSLPRIIAPDKETGSKEIEMEFHGQIGQLIVFPSTLKHAVGANLEPHARLTLSVNSWIKGAAGRAEELAYLPETLDGYTPNSSRV
jgi:hypothetical protein